MIGLPHLESLSIDRTRPRCARHRCTSRACRYRGQGLAHDHGIRIAAHGLRFRCRQLNLRRPERGSGVRHCCSDGRPGSLTRRIRQLLGPGHRQIQSLWPNPACVLRNCTGRAREGMPNLFHRRRHPPRFEVFSNEPRALGRSVSVSLQRDLARLFVKNLARTEFERGDESKWGSPWLDGPPRGNRPPRQGKANHRRRI